MNTTGKILLAVITAGLIFGATVVWTAGRAKADPTLSVGDQAPDYTLLDQNNKPHTLSKLHGKVVLLAFYPADFTPGCTIEAHSLTAANKDLLKMHVHVFGISVQTTTSHAKFCHQEGIPYTLLADTTKVVSTQYSGLMSFGVANRVTFIIGKDGKIVYIDPAVNSHITTCGEDWVTWLKQNPQVFKHG